MSNATAPASVAAKESVISTQVSPGRRWKRTAEPRKSAKKRTSGRPSCAALCSPGSGKEIESASKICGCSSTITLVGPRKTEKVSTGTMRMATSSTQLTDSKKARNHQPAAVTAANLTKFAATSSPASSKRTARVTSAITAPPRATGVAARQSGSASQVSEKNAGMRTSPTKATSPQVERLGSDSETP